MSKILGEIVEGIIKKGAREGGEQTVQEVAERALKEAAERGLTEITAATAREAAEAAFAKVGTNTAANATAALEGTFMPSRAGDVPVFRAGAAPALRAREIGGDKLGGGKIAASRPVDSDGLGGGAPDAALNVRRSTGSAPKGEVLPEPTQIFVKAADAPPSGASQNPAGEVTPSTAAKPAAAQTPTPASASAPQPQASAPQPQASATQPQASATQPQASAPQPQAAAPQPQAAAPMTSAARNLVADISQVKSMLKLNDGGQIDVEKYITMKDRKILRDALKVQKNDPDALQQAKEAVAGNVGSRILMEAKMHADSIGTDWTLIYRDFSIKYRLFEYKQTGIDTTTGATQGNLRTTVDPDLVSRVNTAINQSDFVGIRTAVNVAIPPLAPLIGRTERLSQRLHPGIWENWRNLGFSIALFTGAGALSEFAESDRNKDEGKTGQDFTFSTREALDKGVPIMWAEDEQPKNFGELIKEFVEPVASGNSFSILRNMKDVIVDGKSEKEATLQTPSAIEEEFKSAQEALGKLESPSEIIPVDPAVKAEQEFKAAQEALKK